MINPSRIKVFLSRLPFGWGEIPPFGLMELCLPSVLAIWQEGEADKSERIRECCFLLFVQNKHTHIQTNRQAPLKRHTCKIAGNLLHVQLQLHSLALTSAWTLSYLVSLARSTHASESKQNQPPLRLPPVFLPLPFRCPLHRLVAVVATTTAIAFVEGDIN